MPKGKFKAYLVLVPLRQQYPHTQQSPQSLSNTRRLNELIVPLNQHLSQCLGTRHQNPALIEQPTVVQHAVIGHIIDPVPLRLSRRISKDAWEMPENRVAILHRSVNSLVSGEQKRCKASCSTEERSTYRRLRNMSQRTEHKRIHDHAPHGAGKILQREQHQRRLHEPALRERALGRILLAEEGECAGGEQQRALRYSHAACRRGISGQRTGKTQERLAMAARHDAKPRSS